MTERVLAPAVRVEAEVSLKLGRVELNPFAQERVQIVRRRVRRVVNGECVDGGDDVGIRYLVILREGFA